MPKTVFLDTMVFLHYQSFDQINWLEIAGTDEVTIVIPPVTIRELNEKKDTQQMSRVRKRAGAVIRQLHRLFESGQPAQLQRGIYVYFEDRDPSIDFTAHSLNAGIQDDILMASIIMHKEENPDVDVILVTSDYGLTLVAKAGRQGIATVMLPDNLRIPSTPDPEQARIRELEKEVLELKSKIPQLSLIFEDGSQYGKFSLPRPVDFAPEDLEIKLNEVKRRYPKIDKQPKKTPEQRNTAASGTQLDHLSAISDFAARVARSGWDTVSAEDIARYNEQLDEFYGVYSKHWQREVELKNLRRRTLRLDLLVANDGTAPAEDIDVFLFFPDGFRLAREENLPKVSTPPQPPSKPRTQMEKMLGSITGVDWMLQSIVPEPPHLRGLFESIGPPPNVSAPDIRQTNSYEVEVHVQKVKHNLHEEFDPLYILFRSYESAQSFHIDYRILAANVPQEVTGKLHVVIEKD
jgi:hypothetical protein